MDKEDYFALTERIRELEKELKLYKDYDRVTGLYNKAAFCRRVEKIFCAFPQDAFQILFLDIEHFKLINDFYGMEQGDHLLSYAAEQIRGRFAGNAVCYARWGADTFVIFRPSASREKCLETAEDMHRALKNYPLDMEVRSVIGVYEIKERQISVELMCDRAGIAAASVKGNYTAHVAWYEKSMRNLLVEEHELLNGLDSSLAAGEFEVYIQPKCNMRTGYIVGGEALARWRHSQKGMISPKDFIPVFERNGFVKQLDPYIWEQTAQWLHARDKAGEPVLPISVNISRIDIFGMDLCRFFEELIRRYELRRDWLELEITEGACINQTEKVIGVINRLMDHGFTVLLDDFGSGYSSLNMLKDINVDVLKLDMRFLDNDHKKSHNILESVVRMARWMDLKIVAEGVEQEAQEDFLKKIGCTYAQGFYYYRPMPLAEYEALLDTPGKADFEDHMREDNASTIIHMRDFFAEDMLSEVLLTNLMGMVVIYAFDGKEVSVVQGNLRYYQILHPQAPHGADVSRDANFQIEKEDRQAFVKTFRQAGQAGDEGAEVTVRRYLHDGRRVWLKLHIFFLSEKNGKGIYYASISDVTDTMNALVEVRLSEELFRSALESEQDLVFEVDLKERKAKYTEQIRQLLGLEDVILRVPEDFTTQGYVPPEHVPAFCRMYERIFAGAEQAGCTIQMYVGENRRVWSRITLTAIRDENGRAAKAVGLVRNVTREKELEARFRNCWLEKDVLSPFRLGI